MIDKYSNHPTPNDQKVRFTLKHNRTNNRFFKVCVALIFFACSCPSPTPPMADYQLVDYIATDSVYDGKLFTYGDSLIMIYKPSRYQVVESYRIFNITNPHHAIPLSSGFLPIQHYFIAYASEEDAGYALIRYNNKLTIVSLNDLACSTLHIHFPDMIYSAKYRSGYIYLGCTDGLHIWDISIPGNYQEIFTENDTIRNWTAQTYIQDSILFVSYERRYVMWNIRNPVIPRKIIERPFSFSFYSLYLKDSLLIGFAGGDEEIYTSLCRFVYRGDSFALVDYTGYEDGFHDISYSDSIIYARGSKNIFIFSTQNLSPRDSIQPICLNPWDLISMTTHAGIIYTLTNTGLAVYERSSQ
jgi:hypothetical protein